MWQRFFILDLQSFIVEIDKAIYISEGRRPILYTILAALAFLLVIVVLIIFFSGHNIFKPEFLYKKYQAESIAGAIVLFACGIQFSRVKNIILDVNQKRIKLEWQVGPFKKGKWEELKEIDHLSVFGSGSESSKKYEVNLWFKEKGRKLIYTSTDDTATLLIAEEIAKRLKVDYWDSTDPHNKKLISYKDL